MPEYRTVKEFNSDEYIVKRSRFIGYAKPVTTVEEANDFINEIKSKHWDATHNVYAYILRDGGVKRYSDDGEPGGTAGKPMLEVLLGEGVRNAAVVVTRYFGGVLLGTGGLVRAYTQAAQEGLRNSRTGWMRYGCLLAMETDYNGIGKILYLLGQRGLEPKDAQYTDAVSLKVLVPYEMREGLEKDITEATCGKTIISLEEEMFFLDEE